LNEEYWKLVAAFTFYAHYYQTKGAKATPSTYTHLADK
jgi:hypothetical protein